LSHDVENEMLQRLSHTVLRQIADDVRRDGYYAIIVDETTDVSTVEQVSICIRHVDDDWNVSEDCWNVCNRKNGCINADESCDRRFASLKLIGVSA